MFKLPKAFAKRKANPTEDLKDTPSSKACRERLSQIISVFVKCTMRVDSTFSWKVQPLEARVELATRDMPAYSGTYRPITG